MNWLVETRGGQSETAQIHRVWFGDCWASLLFSLLLFWTMGSLASEPTKGANGESVAQNSALATEFHLSVFGDAFISGDADDQSEWAGRADVKFRFDGERAGLWAGLNVNAHLEYVGGGNVNESPSGAIFPLNLWTALPRATGDSNATVSLTASQSLSETLTLAIGKFNVVDMADQAPLVGGRGRGSFHYTGIAAPPSFVFPPYIFGGQLTLRTEPASLALLVYDARTAHGEAFWDDPIEDLTYNISATFNARPGGFPGFYTFNYIHSTATGLDFSSLLFGPDTGGYSTTLKGYDYGAFKFQQYLSIDPNDPNRGWGVFGQIGVGDSNPNPLGASYLLGLGGNSPVATRPSDRWGVAVSRYDWSSKLIAGLEPLGVLLQAETVVEGFYEASFNDHFRTGLNVMYIEPGLIGSADGWMIGLRTRVIF